MWLMQMGEVIFGGVGSGLYGMLAFIFIAVFVAGLMVGRTPEYLGKKIEIFEMKMAVLIVLIPVLTVLLGTATALLVPAGRAGIFNPGPQGFSEVLYAFSSAGNNNGSAFAGLNANSPFYNSVLGISHVDSPVCLDHSGTGDGRIAFRKEESGGEFRDIIHAYPALCSLVDRCDRHRWSTQFPASVSAGPHRAAVDARHGEVEQMMMNDPQSVARRLKIYRRAMLDAFLKLDPRRQVRNPVMFVVEVGSLLTTLLWVQELVDGNADMAGFTGAITLWLWITLLFANFSEALAEGRGKAQAESLRQARQDTPAKYLRRQTENLETARQEVTLVSSSTLRKNDLYLVETGDILPADGEIVYGIASVDESAVTGESAPVVRESGGDRSAVTGGTHLLSDWLIVRVSTNPGQGFLDQMISMVEGARRQKTPNEIALSILLSSLTIVFLVVCVTLLPLFPIQCSGSWPGDTHHHYGVGGFAYLPDPDDHRWIVISHWHRWNGPADTA